MRRPVHFEIHAEEPERAAEFYRSVFGWTFERWSGPVPYWLISTGQDAPGIDGGLVERHGPGPQPGTPVTGYVITMTVDDLDATTDAVTSGGGAVVSPRAPVPGIGWMAYCVDTEGNQFGVMQRDGSAGGS